MHCGRKGAKQRVPCLQGGASQRLRFWDIMMSNPYGAAPSCIPTGLTGTTSTCCSGQVGTSAANLNKCCIADGGGMQAVGGCNIETSDLCCSSSCNAGLGSCDSLDIGK